MRNTINLYCLRNKVTVDELSLMLGISRDETLRILKEESVVPSELVPKLCRIFNCKPEDLIL